MKVIIEISARNSIFDAAMTDIATGGNEDFHLSFESARQLFAEITPTRLELLDTLRKNGPRSIYALAKAAARNYSSVYTDIVRLIDSGYSSRPIARWLRFHSIILRFIFSWQKPPNLGLQM